MKYFYFLLLSLVFFANSCQNENEKKIDVVFGRLQTSTYIAESVANTVIAIWKESDKSSLIPKLKETGTLKIIDSLRNESDMINSLVDSLHDVPADYWGDYKALYQMTGIFSEWVKTNLHPSFFKNVDDYKTENKNYKTKMDKYLNEYINNH